MSILRKLKNKKQGRGTLAHKGHLDDTTRKSTLGARTASAPERAEREARGRRANALLLGSRHGRWTLGVKMVL